MQSPASHNAHRQPFNRPKLPLGDEPIHGQRQGTGFPAVYHDRHAVRDSGNVLVTDKTTTHDHCSDLLETGDPSDQAELRADPETYRDPASLPAEPSSPGDGAIADGGTPGESGDPWGAAAFLDDVEGTAYGTTPEQLREGLEVLVTAEAVWVTPGIPFLVPMFAGLVVALTYGDLLFSLLSVVGVG